MPLRAPADAAPSHPFLPASLSQAQRHQPAAFHIDIAEARTKEGKFYIFVAIDRTSKFAFVQLHEQADRPTTVSLLEALIEAVPYRLHTILTDNGIQFADLPRNRNG